MQNDNTGYCPKGFADQEDENGQVILGSWRNAVPPNSMYGNSLCSKGTGRTSQKAFSIREHFKLYFSSEVGKLDWQDSSVYYGK